MAVHGRATGLLQRAAGQTMESIAALGKQWTVEGQESDRLAMEKTWDLGCEQNTGGWAG